MISDRMTTPVRPTPALQCTRTGRFVFFGSLELLVCRLTDWISSKYAETEIEQFKETRQDKTLNSYAA